MTTNIISISMHCISDSSITPPSSHVTGQAKLDRSRKKACQWLYVSRSYAITSLLIRYAYVINIHRVWMVLGFDIASDFALGDRQRAVWVRAGCRQGKVRQYICWCVVLLLVLVIVLGCAGVGGGWWWVGGCGAQRVCAGLGARAEKGRWVGDDEAQSWVARPSHVRVSPAPHCRRVSRV